MSVLLPGRHTSPICRGTSEPPAHRIGRSVGRASRTGLRISLRCVKAGSKQEIRLSVVPEAYLIVVNGVRILASLCSVFLYLVQSRYSLSSSGKPDVSEPAHNYGDGKCILHAKKDEGHGCGGPAA